MKRNLVQLVTCFVLILGWSISIPSNAQENRTHTIKQGETLYRITQIYQVSAADLCEANPGLTATHFPVGMNLVIPDGNGTKSMPSEPVQTGKAVKIAVVLPFGLDENLNESARMLEFYQGFLMAVDTLKKQNISIDVYAYDTGKEGGSIQHILESEELKQMDIILGGYYWGHIKQLSDFSKRHRIKMILPFSSNDYFVSNNPDLFMINTPQPYLYPVVQNNFRQYFPDAQIFFLNSKLGKEDKKDFVESFKYKLIAQKEPFEILSPEMDIAEIGKKLKKKKEYFFIPSSGDNKVLEEWMSILTDLKEANQDKVIRLFGYPEWQTYTGQYISRFYNLDTYIYSTFYTSNIFLSSQRFKANFRKWYHKDPAVTFPRYSMLGYDIGLYFITAVSRYGTDFIAELPQLGDVATLQNGFRFERINDHGGFLNKNVYFINFSKNMEIIKTELR